MSEYKPYPVSIDYNNESKKDLSLLSSYDYFLPEDLIAQTPIKKRDASKLLVLNRENGDIRHTVFTSVTEYLRPGDALVINDTKVIPARIFGTKPDHTAKIETLLLERVDGDVWNCLVKPGRKLQIGDEIIYSDRLSGKVVDITDDGSRHIKFSYDGSFNEILDEVGVMPLPPYITKKLEDKSRYQTVYAKHDGSAAAPTAGLHFTPELLEKISAMGVTIVRICLHVGLGTFRPVKEQSILDHKMHVEKIEITKEAADTINRIKDNGGRIFAVGTTSCRTLESCGTENGYVNAYKGETGIFIYPGYKFKVIDALITNFHLPESTLIMLVSSFAGYDFTMKAYKEAVRERYRFFSFGDAMLIK